MIELWGLKTCDTCRKALKEIQAAGKEAEIADIREGLDAARLARWLEAAGAEALVNRKSTTWRGLSEADRAQAPATLLLAHPALVKRPVIEHEGRVLVGWDAASRAALL
ncbi:MAG: ArsC/Spx/MgsR family protein [Pikeienuella sp.]|uniref:ArsC/Spx/MgsR family protein n=1 Tax=Pikeienuella sp. TaxID=2831957 RepID=UPI00391AB7C8